MKERYDVEKASKFWAEYRDLCLRHGFHIDSYEACWIEETASWEHSLSLPEKPPLRWKDDGTREA